MDDTIKEKIFAVVQAVLMITLVCAILLTPARTGAVLVQQAETDKYVELTDKQMVFGQDIVQSELNKKLGL